MHRPTPLMDFTSNLQAAANPFEPLTDVFAYLAARNPALLVAASALLMETAQQITGDHVLRADYETVAVSIDTLLDGVL